jgi:hypothetical protein
MNERRADCRQPLGEESHGQASTITSHSAAANDQATVPASRVAMLLSSTRLSKQPTRSRRSPCRPPGSWSIDGPGTPGLPECRAAPNPLPPSPLGLGRPFHEKSAARKAAPRVLGWSRPPAHCGLRPTTENDSNFGINRIGKVDRQA